MSHVLICLLMTCAGKGSATSRCGAPPSSAQSRPRTNSRTQRSDPGLPSATPPPHRPTLLESSLSVFHAEFVIFLFLHFLHASSPRAFKAWKALDELDAGECDGLTYEQIEVVPSTPTDSSLSHVCPLAGTAPRHVPEARRKQILHTLPTWRVVC